MASLAPIRLEITGNSRGAVNAINQTKQALTGLEAAGSKIQNFGRGLTNIGQQALTGVTLPLVGIGVAATKLAADYGDAMSQLRQASGATQGEMRKFRQEADRLSESGIFGPTAITQAMVELSKAGLKPAAINAGALQASMDLASASGMELAESSTLIVRAMGQFNLTAKDTPAIADALAGAAAASSADVSDMAIALAQGGGSAAAANQSLQETAGLLGLMADKAGIVGSDAGTSIKTFFARITDPAAQQAMRDANIQLVNQKGNIKGIIDIQKELIRETRDLTNEEKQATLGKIFGSDAKRVAIALTRGETAEVRKYIKAARDKQAAEEQSAARMGKLSESLAKARVALEKAGIALGQALGPYIEKVANWVADLAKSFSKLSPSMRDAIVKAGIAAAVFGPLAIVVGNVVTAVGGLVAMLGKLKTPPGAGKMATDLERIGTSSTAAVGGLSALTRLLPLLSVPAGWTAFTSGLDFLSKGWSQQFPQATGALDAFVRTTKTLVPGVGPLLVFAEDINTALGELEIPKRSIDGVTQFFSAVNEGKGFIDAAAEAWNAFVNGPTPEPPDLKSNVNGYIDNLNAQIKNKKLEIDATTDPAMKKARELELRALQITKRKYKMQFGEEGAEKVANQAERAAKAAERWANKKYKAILAAEDREWRRKYEKVVGDGKKIDGKTYKPNVDADYTRWLRKYTIVDSMGRRWDATTYEATLDANTDAAISAAIAATQRINAMSASIYVDLVGPGAGGGGGGGGGGSWGGEDDPTTPFARALSAALEPTQSVVAAASMRRAVSGSAGSIWNIISGGLNLKRVIRLTLEIGGLNKWDKAFSEVYRKVGQLAQKTNKDGDPTENAKRAKKALNGLVRVVNENGRTIDRLTYDRAREKLRSLQQEMREYIRTIREAANAVDVGAAWESALGNYETKIQELKDLQKSMADESWNPTAVTYYQAKIDQVTAALRNMGATENAVTGEWTANNSAALRNNLNAQLDTTRRFTDDLKTLLERGLGQGAFDQLISVGPEKGAEIAKALVNDRELATRFNTVYNQATDLAASAGQRAANEFLQPQVNAYESAITKWELRLAAFAKKEFKVNVGLRLKKGDLPDWLWKALQKSPSNGGAGFERSGGGSGAAQVVNNIYIEGQLIDREGAARAIEEVLVEHSARMGGWA